MSDPIDWRATDGHPPASTLLMHMEGELAGRGATLVSGHVKDCWICRTECERLNRGMYALVEYREQILRQGAPPPPLARGLFRKRLRELPAAERKGPLLSLILAFRDLREMQEHRADWISAAISAALIAALLVFPIVQPPTVNAKEILDRARSSARIALRSPRQVLHQRVEIRQGRQVWQRDLYFGPAQVAPQSPEPTRELASAMDLARIEWNDPLGVDGFEKWRDAQVHKRDAVSHSPDSFTLRTTSLDAGPVRSASLTVSPADWRPVAEDVEFREGPPLEIRELAFQIQELPPPVESFADPPIWKAPAGEASQVERSVPMETELDETEVRLREAFHRVGADVDEVPRIEQVGHEIHFHAVTQTAKRRAELLAAVRDIPHVAWDVSDAEIGVPGTARSSAGNEADAAAGRQVYLSDPPLAKSLWEYFGGLDPANAYLARVRDSYFELLVDSSALKRLAERYPDEEWGRLSPESRARLDRIAADHVGRMRSNANDYLTLVSPLLDEMMERQSLAIGPPADAAGADAAPSGCQSWRSEAVPIARQIQRLQSSFRELFIVDQTDTPVSLSAGNLLRESAAARSILQQRLEGLCQP
jgi:hypothetical protein